MRCSKFSYWDKQDIYHQYTIYYTTNLLDWIGESRKWQGITLKYAWPSPDLVYRSLRWTRNKAQLSAALPPATVPGTRTGGAAWERAQLPGFSLLAPGCGNLSWLRQNFSQGRQAADQRWPRRSPGATRYFSLLTKQNPPAILWSIIYMIIHI